MLVIEKGLPLTVGEVLEDLHVGADRVVLSGEQDAEIAGEALADDLADAFQRGLNLAESSPGDSMTRDEVHVRVVAKRRRDPTGNLSRGLPIDMHEECCPIGG